MYVCAYRCLRKCLTVAEKSALWNVWQLVSLFVRTEHLTIQWRWVWVCVCARAVVYLVRMVLIRQNSESNTASGCIFCLLCTIQLISHENSGWKYEISTFFSSRILNYHFESSRKILDFHAGFLFFLWWHKIDTIWVLSISALTISAANKIEEEERTYNYIYYRHVPRERKIERRQKQEKEKHREWECCFNGAFVCAYGCVSVLVTVRHIQRDRERARANKLNILYTPSYNSNCKCYTVLWNLERHHLRSLARARVQKRETESTRLRYCHLSDHTPIFG